MIASMGFVKIRQDFRVCISFGWFRVVSGRVSGVSFGCVSKSFGCPQWVVGKSFGCWWLGHQNMSGFSGVGVGARTAGESFGC